MDEQEFVEILEDLTHNDDLVRGMAVWRLINKGVDERALPSLNLLLEEPLDRLIAAGAISRITPDDPRVKPILLEGLKQDYSSRAAACEFLGDLKDNSVVPEITPLMKDKQLQVRFPAAVAIGQLTGVWSHAITELMKQLTSKHFHIRLHAKLSLDKLGPHARDMVPLIKRALKTVRWHVRVDLEEVLNELITE